MGGLIASPSSGVRSLYRSPTGPFSVVVNFEVPII